MYFRQLYNNIVHEASSTKPLLAPTPQTPSLCSKSSDSDEERRRDFGLQFVIFGSATEVTINVNLIITRSCNLFTMFPD